MFDIKNLTRIPLLALLAVVFSAAVFAQGGVKGKVRSRDGSGIPNATITARSSGEDIRSVRSDSKGNFVMEGLRAGTYNFVFDADGYGTGVKYGVEVKNGKTLDLGSRLILNVDRGTLVLVRGSVFFKEGVSVTGAKVDVERVNSDGSTKKIGTYYTSMSGEFVVRQPAGPQKIRVTAKYKDVTGTKEIDVDGAAIYGLAITLDLSAKDK